MKSTADIGDITSLRLPFPLVYLKIIAKYRKLILLYPTQGLAALQQGEECDFLCLLMA